MKRESAILVLGLLALSCTVPDSDPSSAVCGGSAEQGLYGLLGQPASLQPGEKVCAPAVCGEADRLAPGLVSVNDGPAPYTLTSNETAASTVEMARVYTEELGVTSVRPDEAGRAFDIRCMFPVNDLGSIPDPWDDANWNWDESDAYFSAIVDAGMAPLLKLAVTTWTSTRLTGLSYYDQTLDAPHYVIEPQPFAGCAPWPAISPVIEEVGADLVLKIVDRYNDPERFGFNGLPALDADTWGATGGFAGVELMNEWNFLVCGPLGGLPAAVCQEAGGEVSSAQWAEACAGEPYEWGSRYWDGTPSQAYDFYTKTALALREAHPQVRVGGPASGTGGSFWPCGTSAGVGGGWLTGFLDAVRASDAPLDFFSWHYYDVGQGPQADGGPAFAQVREQIQGLLAAADLADVPQVVTEYNTRFNLGATTALVGSSAGAAQNTAKLVEMSEAGMPAAFLYTGRDGAFEPENPYSFPLGCTPEFEGRPGSGCTCDPKTGCTPQCSPENLVFTGVWSSCPVDDLSSVADLPACQQGDCQFGPSPNSGMGAVLADGTLKPMGAAMNFWAAARGRRLLSLREPAATALRQAGVYAVAWQVPGDSRFASLLLANPFDSASGALPSVADLFPGDARVVGSSRVAQFRQGELTVPVSGADGVSSQETLVGEVAPGCDLQPVGDGPLAPLPPYETQLLAVQYDDGCLCDE